MGEDDGAPESKEAQPLPSHYTSRILSHSWRNLYFAPPEMTVP